MMRGLEVPELFETGPTPQMLGLVRLVPVLWLDVSALTLLALVQYSPEVLSVRYQRHVNL